MLKCSHFAQYALKLELWPKQQEIIDSYFGGPVTHGVWALGRRCVVADTLVATSNGMVEIGSLAGSGEAIDHEWEHCHLEVAQPYKERRQASRFYKGGRQDIIRIRTSRGFEVAGTPNHPVMVMSEKGLHEWRPLGALSQGDQIVTRPGANVWPDSCPPIADFACKAKEAAETSPNAKSIQPPSTLTKDLAYALGALVGDGTWTMKSYVQLTCHEDDAPFMAESLQRGLGVPFTLKRDARRNSACSLNFYSKYYRKFLNDLGWIADVKRDQKQVPWVIMQSPRPIVCAFLSGLFDTDGGVEKNGKTIAFSTACKTLAREVHMLLFNLGIISRITAKKVQGKDYWIITLLGLEARQQFCHTIGFRLPRKQLKALQALDVARGGGNSQAIPHQKGWLRRLASDLGCRKGDDLLTRIRSCVGNAIKGGKEEFNARRLPGLIKLLDEHNVNGEVAEHFRELALVSYFYDPVVSIQKEDPQEVFDFHVPIGNAFVANGIVNHNSGKTLMAAVAALYVCFVLEANYKRRVRKNEKWYIITVANDQNQAKIALNNIRQLLVESQFAKEIVRETATEIEISNGSVFQAIPASARASRGKAVAMCIMDELAFSLEGDANRGAKAIYTALEPSVAQFGGHGRFLELSSPWLTDGLFYEHYCEAQGGDFPFMQAVNIPTWQINPNLPWGCPFLEAALKRDPDAFWVEYGAQFSKNLSALLAPEVVDAAVDKRRGILLPQAQFKGMYYLALDPAKGGVGRDNYTACIVHYEGETLIVDKFHSFDADFEINGKKEVNIKAVEQWIREHHTAYGFESIVLDQFNSASTIQTLAESLPISELTWSVSTKMKAFSKMRQLFNAGLITLYSHEVAIKQIKGLSVVYRQSGQWTVTGGKEANVDDFPFALAAAILEASESDDIDWINSLVR